LTLTGVLAALGLMLSVTREATPHLVLATPAPRSSVDSSPPVVLGGATRGDPAVTAARKVGERFLRTYAAFLYGHTSAAGLEGATADVRQALRHSRLRVPPARRERTPAIVGVQAVHQAASVVQVTATVDDGDISRYVVTAIVELHRGRWRVTQLADD
jgi:uncharacterized protein DUF6459